MIADVENSGVIAVQNSAMYVLGLGEPALVRYGMNSVLLTVPTSWLSDAQFHRRPRKEKPWWRTSGGTLRSITSVIIPIGSGFAVGVIVRGVKGTFLTSFTSVLIVLFLHAPHAVINGFDRRYVAYSLSSVSLLLFVGDRVLRK